MKEYLEFKIDSKITQELLRKDPLLKPLFDSQSDMKLELATDPFVALVSSIVSQQLSGRVAEVIFGRVKDYFQDDITPTRVLNAPIEELRALGLSYRKIDYVRSLATLTEKKEIDIRNIHHLSDTEIIEQLVKVKGIGVWTAQMFLIFSLGREDVFSALDLGLKNALKKLYNNAELTMEQMEDISTRWSPYRSYVSLLLWKSLNNR